ncbi:MAG: L-histidine N(alpha)-methyltransferase [SAR324 cluster bacterium]
MDRRQPHPAPLRLEEVRPAPRLTLLCQPQQEQRQDLRAEVERGLALSPKRLAPRFFYDEEGSRLFERITATPEYYPTRTEAALLRRYGAEIVLAALGREAAPGTGAAPTLVELGSGSSAKTRVLLDAYGAARPLTYVPIDVSAEAVRSFGAALLRDYPALTIRGLVCDYRGAAEFLRAGPAGSRLFLFLGSSLGNYDPPDARDLLSLVRSAMGPRDRFLLGLDLKKDPALLHAAYNDAGGVTAAFNLNLLARINRELGGHFELERFAHVAFYDGTAGRIEMHLESLSDQVVRIDAIGRSYGFRRGERLHTENSYKYGPADVHALLQGTGLTLLRQWQDDRQWFALSLLGPI